MHQANLFQIWSDTDTLASGISLYWVQSHVILTVRKKLGINIRLNLNTALHPRIYIQLSEVCSGTATLCKVDEMMKKEDHLQILQLHCISTDVCITITPPWKKDSSTEWLKLIFIFISVMLDIVTSTSWCELIWSFCPAVSLYSSSHH